jgi:hypothetical protein
MPAGYRRFALSTTASPTTAALLRARLAALDESTDERASAIRRELTQNITIIEEDSSFGLHMSFHSGGLMPGTSLHTGTRPIVRRG